MRARTSPLCQPAMLVALALILSGDHGAALADESDRIRPYEANPHYWQYKGEPVLLLGGSWQDNLFNHPVGLEKNLDVLKSVGGSYVRNVMSHRNAGNVFAYKQVDGKFDLDQCGPSGPGSASLLRLDTGHAPLPL